MILERLLRPGSIAVVGGGTWCAAVIEQNRQIGFTGPIWPVHPKKANITGLPAFASLEDLPSAPDATFIGVNRHATIEVVEKLQAMEAGGAVCFASGFKEAKDGTALNEQLLHAAGEMPILGPNCYGILNGLDKIALWPDQHGLTPVSSGVAILTQSSNIAINLTMQKRGLPIAYIITAGNQAQQGLAGIAMDVLQDKRVTALGLYVESFGDIRAFEALALLAADLGKSIVALKVGQSEESQRATISHTASLAGSSAGAEAFLKRLGMASVSSLGSFLETLKIFHCHGQLGGNRIASLSCSGGEASVMADTSKRAGLHFPPLEERQKNGLKEHLSSMVHLANPLDYHTDIWRNKSALQAVFAALSGQNIDLTLIVLDFPRLDKCDASDWMITIEAIEAAAAETNCRYGVIASIPENMPEDIAERLLEKGIIPLCDFDHSCTAIQAAASLNYNDPEPVLLAKLPEKTRVMTEGEAKDALARVGMDTPERAQHLNLEEVASSAAKIGFPVALKGENIAHKTEAHAVFLNLMNKNEVLEAAATMPVNSFLIEEMVTGAIAELLIGVMLDPVHGFIMTIAAGGTLTELLDDRQSLLIPSGRADIRHALSGLKTNAILRGFRGGEAASQEAIINAIMHLQDYVIANAKEIVEIEINPLICTRERAIIADALLVKGIS